MSVNKISESVYSVGVLDPNLRVFDIVMQARHGTSYNSYFIVGEKNVVIDTAPREYFDEFYFNLSSLVDVSTIDYVVLNHTEPDHSGSLKKLLQINPNIKVVCTQIGYKFIREMTNCDFDCIKVKDSETLDIGSSCLKFVVSPMLHWPDSMMTWYEKDEILFSCDFLGSHFCEPTGRDVDIRYKQEYLHEFRYYFDGIFSPFKSHVVSGIKKIESLPIKVICPSHGPILTSTLRDRMNDYSLWSTPQAVKTKKVITIIYASAYGFTKKLAEAAAAKLREKQDVVVHLIDVVTTSKDVIIDYISGSDAIMVGSCTINRDAPKVIWDILSSVDAINSRGKVAGCFGSYGWSGEAVDMIKSRLSSLGFKVHAESVKAKFNPTDEILSSVQNLALELYNQVEP